MNPLSNASLDALRTRGVCVPAYDRARVRTGVVHFGPGAFHRVHQACYLDDALAHDPRWGICEVSLQSPALRDALARQDNLYTMAILDAQPSWRVIGAVTGVLVARESPAAVLRQLLDPQVHLVTATITEKGYCLAGDGGLDVSHPDIRHDLDNPSTPFTLVGYLAEALRQRRAAGMAAPNIVSCDNLTDNGRRLRRAVIEFARPRDAELAAWIEGEVAFPCTMVDSITPASDDALRASVAERLGLIDGWPVQRESFLQWAIEDDLRAPAPDWQSIGVTITSDVAGYERAKLRLLNGAHSSLAYIGTLAGLETVAQAMTQDVLSQFVRQLMENEIMPSIAAPSGLDLQQYIEAVLQRFRNPAIRHKLSQIAWDGSQKIPFRLLGTIAENLAARRPIERLCLAIAAWFHFVRRKARAGERAVDPLADRLAHIGQACTGDARHDVALFLALPNVFPPTLAAEGSFRAALERAYVLLAPLESAAGLGRALKLAGG